MAKIISLCEAALGLAKVRYEKSGGNSLDFPNKMELAEKVIQIITRMISDQSSDIETIISLEYDCDGDIDIYPDTYNNSSENAIVCDNSDEDDSEDEENSEELSQQVSQDWEETRIDEVNFSYQEMVNILSFYDKAKKNKFAQTKRRYNKVKYPVTIIRIRDYVNKKNTVANKFKELEHFVIHRFNSARLSMFHVSELDLIRWGAIKARELDLKFKASRKWLHSFKVRNRIVARKITKYVTAREIENQDNVEDEACCFVNEVNMHRVGLSPEFIFNFDQSGFTYEFSPKRTLSHKGEKDTHGLVKSQNAKSHSYTIMPLISMAGRLTGKLLICLQEPKGVLGPRISESLVVPDNIYVTTSKSGKLDKRIMTNWINDCVKPLTNDNDIMLIYDSWGGQVDDEIYAELGEKCKREQIPAGATSLVQPLDVCIFRQYKRFRRKIFERVILDEINLDMHKRENVLRMHSLIFDQLSSEAFVPMFQYAWFACTYTEDRITFNNVNQLLFTMNCDKCESDMCQGENFIRCSHCNLHLCFDHFFIENHNHINRHD